MNKILQLLIMLATILIGSKASFAQSINDKEIFEKTFKDVSEKNKAYKTYRYVSANGTIIITYNDLTEESYNATRISKADRKSTRLNSSHVRISYAVFCLKKKKT